VNVTINEEIMLIVSELNKYKEILQTILINQINLKEYQVTKYIDICIILHDKSINKREMLKSLRKVLLNKINTSMSILVYYRAEFLERSIIKCSLEYEIRKSGKVIYKR